MGYKSWAPGYRGRLTVYTYHAHKLQYHIPIYFDIIVEIRLKHEGKIFVKLIIFYIHIKISINYYISFPQSAKNQYFLILIEDIQ